AGQRELPPRPAFVVERSRPTERLLDRCRALRGDPRVGVVVLVAVAVVAGFVWYRIGIAGAGQSPLPAAPAGATRPLPARPRPVPARTSPSSSAAVPSTTVRVAPAASGSSSSKGGIIVVHVAGAVVHAGVVELAAGARVIDALEAVGGALAEADLDRLNLAAH